MSKIRKMRIHAFGGPDVLRADEVEFSLPDASQVLVGVMVFDLIGGDTRERSWKFLKRGATLVSTLTEPSQETATQFGVRALRYTVEADGNELADIVNLVASGKVKPHVHRTYSAARGV